MNMYNGEVRQPVCITVSPLNSGFDFDSPLAIAGVNDHAMLAGSITVDGRKIVEAGDTENELVCQ